MAVVWLGSTYGLWVSVIRQIRRQLVKKKTRGYSTNAIVNHREIFAGHAVYPVLDGGFSLNFLNNLVARWLYTVYCRMEWNTVMTAHWELETTIYRELTIEHSNILEHHVNKNPMTSLNCVTLIEGHGDHGYKQGEYKAMVYCQNTILPPFIIKSSQVTTQNKHKTINTFWLVFLGT